MRRGHFLLQPQLPYETRRELLCAQPLPQGCKVNSGLSNKMIRAPGNCISTKHRSAVTQSLIYSRTVPVHQALKSGICVCFKSRSAEVFKSISVCARFGLTRMLWLKLDRTLGVFAIKKNNKNNKKPVKTWIVTLKAPLFFYPDTSVVTCTWKGKWHGLVMPRLRQCKVQIK